LGFGCLFPSISDCQVRDFGKMKKILLIVLPLIDRTFFSTFCEERESRILKKILYAYRGV